MDAGGASQTVFQFIDPTLADISPSVLGLWEAAPTGSTAAVAFGAAGDTAADAPIWRATLPADLATADAQLTAAERRIQAAQTALPAAAARFEALVGAPSAGVAFDISPAGRPLARPEAELLAWLREVREGRPPINFGLSERLASGRGPAMRHVQATVERLRQCAAPYARVETWVQAELLGQTRVSWRGDVDTVWCAGLGPEQGALHQRILALALQSRAMLVRTAVLATQVAAKLALVLSTPGGAILALPPAWRFMDQVLADVGWPA